ncbi:hypothetical protein DICVIV_08170 [Dictyocaulus viviparus]|uniref:Peptidase S1 domain-containing protein n=1 Tax=Dictyocaulus viviparus TaxID=29172 RepID=A0A0D8XPR5_DICVI|nr:hypothetical protein DICVIV_08170 [Dictyocaulus viviparus]
MKHLIFSLLYTSAHFIDVTTTISPLTSYFPYTHLFAHDLAILEIAQPGIIFSNWVQAICLPSRNFSYETGRGCVVSGWGSTSLGEYYIH